MATTNPMFSMTPYIYGIQTPWLLNEYNAGYAIGLEAGRAGKGGPAILDAKTPGWRAGTYRSPQFGVGLRIGFSAGLQQQKK